ncbi:MAG: MBL fold metallo-hydrolase [Bryobacteraceae bacterium]|jgi:L-ascorbate metabolism protein UlaG (beta-lactamase superfamily)
MRNLSFALLIAVSSAFAQSDTFDTAAGPVKITPIMHAAVLLQAGGKNIYIDPAQGSFDGRPPADLILITDIHGDHMAQPTIDKIKKPGTVIFAPKAVADQIHVDTVIANGETKKWGDWTITAVAAYNQTRGPSAGKFFHDKGRGNGYVLTYGGKRFYFSGDTEAIPEVLALKNIDVAFVCMNLPYTMTPEEAAAAVKAFHPAIVYPYHYRGSDLNGFAAGLAGTGIEVRLREWYPK